MKLTIEQAKNYIGCQVQYNGEKLFLGGVSCPDNSRNINYEAVFLIDEQGFADYGYKGWVNIKDIKLILHDLSYLTKKTEHLEGELGGNMCDAYREYLDIFYDDICHSRAIQAPYEIFKIWLSWHIDVFDLIPNDLAIDTNTLKQ